MLSALHVQKIIIIMKKIKAYFIILDLNILLYNFGFQNPLIYFKGIQK
jgi:hypothetical protein